MMLENGDQSRQPFQEMIETSSAASSSSWTNQQRSPSSKLADKVNKASSDLQLIHNFISQNMSADEVQISGKPHSRNTSP